MTTTLEKLNLALTSAYKNTHSSFYRDFYAAEEYTLGAISDIEEWRIVPMLRKSAIQEVPLKNRIFVENSLVDTFRPSSGTTGSSVLVTPRTNYVDYSMLATKFKVARVMSFHPTPHLMECGIREVNPQILFVAGDITQPQITAQLASQADVEMLEIFVFQIDSLLPFLKHSGHNKKIKILHTLGERLGHNQYERLETEFPNATIVQNYAFSESQDIVAVALNNDDTKQRFHYSVSPSYYLEVLGDSGEVISEVGQVGEVVVTTLTVDTLAFPLIRYRTGDLARIESIDSTGELELLSFIGRKELDYLKVPGGILQVSEVERVLKLLFPTEKVSYQIHYQETDGQSHLLIELEPIETMSQDEVSSLLSLHLRLGPSFTYNDGVAKGLYRPFSCRFRSFSKNGTRKHQFLVDHTKEI